MDTLTQPVATGTDERDPASEHRAGRLHRLLSGRPTDPRWARPALLALLGATALLYLWGLGASGWANSFYSTAVQAGTKSWKAFFFGSSDAANFITVDKPPAALWAMELSARAGPDGAGPGGFGGAPGGPRVAGVPGGFTGFAGARPGGF